MPSVVINNPWFIEPKKNGYDLTVTLLDGGIYFDDNEDEEEGDRVDDSNKTLQHQCFLRSVIIN